MCVCVCVCVCMCMRISHIVHTDPRSQSVLCIWDHALCYKDVRDAGVTDGQIMETFQSSLLLARGMLQRGDCLATAAGMF